MGQNVRDWPRRVLSALQQAVRATKALRGSPDGFVGTDTDGFATTTHLGSGTPSNTVFLRGDGTWSTVGSGSITDGDYGDIEVSSSGAQWTVESAGGRHYVSTVAQLEAIVPTLTSGGIVFIAPGTYTLTTTLELLYGGIQLVGAGPRITVLRLLDSNTDIISIQAHTCTIEGMTIHHGTAYEDNGLGAVGSGKGIVLEQEDAFGGSEGNIGSVTIRNVMVLNTGYWCIFDTGVYSYEDISFSDGFSSFNTTFCAAGAGGPRTVEEEAKYPFPIWGYTGAVGTPVGTISTTRNTATPRTLTSAALFANVRVGQFVTGTGIKHGTWVTAKASNSSITISKNVLSSGTSNAVFSRYTNCALSVELVIDNVTCGYANSGGALFLGYGGVAARMKGFKTNQYSFGSYTVHGGALSPVSAVTLGAVHVYGRTRDVFDECCVFQSSQAQSGSAVVLHDDVDATMLSLQNSHSIYFDAPYFEVLSTFCRDGINWYTGFSTAVHANDTAGYRQHWIITGTSCSAIVFDSPFFACNTRKEDALESPANADGYPARILRTLADVGGFGFTMLDGRVNQHRLYYQSLLGRTPADPFANGDFFPTDENGNSTSAPWDEDDFLLEGFEDGGREAPINIQDMIVVNTETGFTRLLGTPGTASVIAREAFRIQNQNRVMRLPPWSDNSQSATGWGNRMDDMRQQTVFQYQGAIRGGTLGYVAGQGRKAIECTANGTTTLTSAALFSGVAVGMKVVGNGVPADTYVTVVTSTSNITLNNSVTAGSEPDDREFYALGTFQREGLWIGSAIENDLRQIPMIRKHTGSGFTSPMAGDLWMHLSGSPVLSVYPNAEFKYYSGAAWNAVFALPDGTALAGDLAYYSATDTPARLAIGSTGALLNVVSGAPAWLSIGSDGQLLTPIGGVAAWKSPVIDGDGNVVTSGGELVFS